MQKLLTLIIAGAILYMVVQHNSSTIKPPAHLTPQEQTNPAELENKNSSIEPTGSFIEKTVSNVLVNILKTDEGKMFFENILKPINAPLAGSGEGFTFNNNNLVNSMFSIKTFGEGDKGPASCGHVVTIEYKILTPTNVVIKEGTATLPLGSEKIAPGLDAVIVGMKTGQTRQATITNKYIQNASSPDSKTSNFKINVVLKEIIPDNFVGSDVKIFDDSINYKLPLVCGNTAIYDAKITKLSTGKVIYDSTTTGMQINMKIGNLNYPVIFSHSLHNKIPVGTRTVIAKGKLFKSFASNFSIIFSDTELPLEEYFMLELSNFDNSIITKNTNLLQDQPKKNTNLLQDNNGN